MKKIRTILLTLMFLFVMPLTVCAAAGPADHYDPRSTDEETAGAWSYIKVAPVSGARSKTHYVYSNYQSTTLPVEGVVEAVEGMTYDQDSNTLTVTDYKQEDIILSIHNMGTAFTLCINGENELRCIKADKDKWDSGMIITGTGSAVLGNASDHIRIPLEVYGDLEMISGVISCRAEVSSVQSAEGNRYTFMVISENSVPVKTSVGYDAVIDGGESTGGTFLVRTRENITFSGDAHETPSIKRKGKKVTWTKTAGATYEVSVNGEVTETGKNSIKVPKKKKVSVRMFTVENCIKAYSPWSKLV